MTRVAVAWKSDLPQEIVKDLSALLDPRLRVPAGEIGIRVSRYGKVITLRVSVEALEEFPAGTPFMSSSLAAQGFPGAPTYPAPGYEGRPFYSLDAGIRASKITTGAVARGEWTWVIP